MSAPPACLVKSIDTGEKTRHSSATEQHVLQSARILGMISGAGGLAVSDDISSVRVSDFSCGVSSMFIVSMVAE